MAQGTLGGCGHTKRAETGAAITAALVRELYADIDNPAPPMPDRLSFPCSMRITARHNIRTGERIGRVQFLSLSGDAVLFDDVWTVAKARTP